MNRIKLGVSALIAVAGIAISLTPVSATVEFMKKEKKACTTCHVAMKSKELNKVGECYKEKKSLDSCKDAK